LAAFLKKLASAPKTSYGNGGTMKSTEKVIEIPIVHFMAFGLERRPICQSEFGPSTEGRVTILVEEVTCSRCLRVINHALANRRNKNMRKNITDKNNSKVKCNETNEDLHQCNKPMSLQPEEVNGSFNKKNNFPPGECR
jgi:hypothetical protein